MARTGREARGTRLIGGAGAVVWIIVSAVTYNPRVHQCKECAAGEDDVYLHKCPICHKYICDEHKFVRSGRVFCSQFCAAFFFHEGDDDD